MESDLKSEISLPNFESLETVNNNIAMLNTMVYKRIVNLIRIEIGNTQGLNAEQCYIKITSVIKKMPFHYRPKESSLPSVFLDVLVPNLVNWPTPIRLQRFLKIERFIEEMENDDYRFHVMSSNDNEYAESQGSNEYNKSVEKDNLFFECEEKDSNASESGNCNQHNEDGYESENKFCYSEYEVEEICNSSKGNDCYYKNECCNNSDFPDCYTNDLPIVSSSCYPDDNQSWEKICEAVFLSSNEISNFLARDFEKKESVSKDLHIFHHNVSSFSQATSPKFDVERDVESEQPLLDFGGVHDSTSNVFAHDDLLDARNVNEGKVNVVSDSFYVDLAEHCFDVSYDEVEDSKGCQSDYRFSSCADKSCKDEFKVYSDIQFDEENDSDQHSLDQHFQNEFSYMVTNQCFECEEVSVKDESDLVNDTTASRQQSDSKHSL